MRLRETEGVRCQMSDVRCQVSGRAGARRLNLQNYLGGILE
jgi:hypothetical protein